MGAIIPAVLHEASRKVPDFTTFVHGSPCNSLYFDHILFLFLGIPSFLWDAKKLDSDNESEKETFTGIVVHRNRKIWDNINTVRLASDVTQPYVLLFVC